MKRCWYVIGAVSSTIVVILLSLCGTGKLHDSTQAGQLRIVSLAPSVTEMLFALDLQDSIVGVTNCCDYPPEAKDIERVGGFGAPNIEKLLVLRPHLVVATGFERSDVAEMLRKAGIQLLELRIHSSKRCSVQVQHTM